MSSDNYVFFQPYLQNNKFVSIGLKMKIKLKDRQN